MTETIKIPELSLAFFAARDLRRKKCDYGGIAEYFPFDDKSFIQMIHVKTQRLVNLTRADRVPNYESVKDNILDLINYASYYYEWLEGVLNE